MTARRRLSAVGVALMAALTWMAWVALPSAIADGCTLTVTTVTGQTFSFPEPVGVPIAQLTVPVAGSESETCITGSGTGTSTATTSTIPGPLSSSSTTTTTTTTTGSETSSSTTPSTSATTATPSATSTSTSPSTSDSGSTSTAAPGTPSTTTTSSSSSTTTTSTSATTPTPTGPGRAEQPSARGTRPAVDKRHRKHRRRHHRHHRAKAKHKHKHKHKSTKPSGKGVPTPKNPTFSLSLPGPAPIGVPNFFIDSFRIPPFLIPIYQAAGIEYQIPWQVLAAINEIETDYGRNLSISSAGAEGWMQFLPSTWKEWGLDANGDGVADPYNPVDAVFTAARYLHAAGASSNLATAVFAYNHASWYVQSVLLRAKLIGGIPAKLVGALTGMVQGHFPVAAPAKYADSSVVALARRQVTGANAAVAIDSNPSSRGTSIFAKQGSPVIAVNDGKIIKLGRSAELGRYVELQDATGNIYTYAHLGSVMARYPVPTAIKITPQDIAKELAAPKITAPTSAASAGSQAATPAPATPAATPLAPASAGSQRSSTSGAPARQRTPAAKAAARSSASAAGSGSAITAPLVKERLFANPSRPASYASGGDLQLSTANQISSFNNYFSDTLHLARNQYRLEPLRPGAIVIGGTILGHIAGPSATVASHLYFMVQPAGRNAPFIDPKPILDGWKLLEATAVYRASGVDPFFGPGAKNPSVGQVLLMSKQQLTYRVLADPRAQIYTCGRRDIQAGLIDRRVLATIEFLSASGLDPYVSGLECGHSLTGSTGTDAAGATGASLDISKINNIPVLGHQGAGSITDLAIRRLLTLQGSMQPDEIISDMSYRGQPNTLALPDHRDRIQITFTPDYGTNRKLSDQIKSILAPGQWIQLINRISQIPEPVVPITPSKYAIRTGTG